MATPAEVVDLFADVREGSSFERARAAANAFRAFASLSASEKRDLAALVAERAAPQLVPKIRAETGLDLTREQVQAVIDMAGRMDAEDIDELRHTLRDQQAREEALRTVGASAATAAAGASGLDDVLTPPAQEAPEPPADDGPPHEEGPETAAERDAPEHRELGPPDLDVDEAELDALGVESELLEVDTEPAPSTSVASAPEPREFVSIFDDLPSLPAFEQRAEGATMTPDRVGVSLADLDQPPSTPGPAVAVADTRGPLAAPTALVTSLRARDTLDLTTRVRAAQQPLVERLREQSSGAGCIRVVRAHLGDLAEMDAVGRMAVVDAVPDGWARRRALQAMLEAQVLPAADVPDLIRRVGSPVARAWLCATAIETRVLDADQLDELLDPRAATRLRGRYR